jgi:hypothetical protein
MPQVIDHIDAIARKKKRAVLYLEFHPASTFHSQVIETDEDHDLYMESKHRISDYKYEKDAVRDEIIENLNRLGVSWVECGPIASESGFSSYKGQIYLDVPMDDDLPLYHELNDYLEYPNGEMRFPTVRFYYLALEVAMQNAHHDEPGFWETWAENF